MSKTIHIIGGMGPQASALLLQRIIALAPSITGAKGCDEFPHIVLHSLPVPDFISNTANIPPAAKIIAKTVADIPQSAVIGMACNTAHLLADQVGLSAREGFVHMPKAVANHISRNKAVNTVGLLASPVTLNSGLYDQVLRDLSIKTLHPSALETTDIEITIRDAISGVVTDKNKKTLRKIGAKLKSRGADTVLLGCTELPLILNGEEGMVSSIDVLAIELLKRSKTA